MGEDMEWTAEVQEQLKALCWGVVTIVPENALAAKLEYSLRQGKPLRVKVGLDPTAADLHLGHTVILQKLRDFQRYGHQVQLVIGDWTARLGDPTGRSSVRKALEPEEILVYAQTYADQVFQILDPARTEVVYNSQWLGKLDLEDILQLTAQMTVARMLEREDFAQRYRGQKPIGLHEFLYPLLQGYDSVVLESDVELGGTDQTFNLLIGRQLQKFYGKREQVAMTLPLLVGLDGKKKMSKSLGNHVGITEDPNNVYGKIMSLSDGVMLDYYKLVTDYTLQEVGKLQRELEDGSQNPMRVKHRLARYVVGRYHGEAAAEVAAEHFQRTVQRRQVPKDLPEVFLAPGEWTIISAMVQAGLAGSRTEARRLVRQGAVRIQGECCSDEQQVLDLSNDLTLQVGKRRFMRIKGTRS
ncbi:tyrosine--tRNA ligase [Pasteuria penetrans]|uniref:tyrosine--tRNA ligase n=1 Tax=Pasteuria penetrans TaxID=86005 RepID=UPI000F9E60E6|nr:tyrosine--tRNA ligase [Pasteuria penetrans]